MKLKRYSLSGLVLGLIVLSTGFIMPLAFWDRYISHNGATGIIGGADAPTYRFMLSELFGGLPFVLVLLGITLIVSSGFCLLFSKTVKTHCHIRSSAISIGLSCVGALGLVCFFTWFTIASFGKMSKYPIEYPVSILLGIACFVIFILFVALYFKERRTNWSVKGVIIDVLASIVYLPAFFFVFAYFQGIIA